MTQSLNVKKKVDFGIFFLDHTRMTFNWNRFYECVVRHFNIPILIIILIKLFTCKFILAIFKSFVTF